MTGKELTIGAERQLFRCWPPAGYFIHEVPMTRRRTLRFHSLDDVLVELSSLDGVQVTTTGKWSFYQILNHLAEYIENSISQYPLRMPFVIRRTIGSMALRYILKTQEMKSGGQNPTAPRQREEGDDRAAMLRLRKAIASFRAYEGRMAEHPFFGLINKEDFEALHAHHAALHLSFAHPEAAQKKSSKEPAVSVVKAAEETAKKAPEKMAKKSTRKVSKQASRKAAKKSATKKLVQK